MAGLDAAPTATLTPELRRRLGVGLTIVGKGLVLGVVAGMNTFVYIKGDIAPDAMPELLPLALIVSAGVANVFFPVDVRRGIGVSLVAIAVGFATHGTAWILPLVVAGYHPLAAQVLAPMYTGRAYLTAVLVLPMSYYSGYFSTLLLAAYRSK
jgi:hypothetical protein